MKKFIKENKKELLKALNSFNITEKGNTLKSITEKNKNIYIDVLNGEKYTVIAKKYNISPSAIRDRIWRITVRLKKFI